MSSRVWRQVSAAIITGGRRRNTKLKRSGGRGGKSAGADGFFVSGLSLIPGLLFLQKHTAVGDFKTFPPVCWHSNNKVYIVYNSVYSLFKLVLYFFTFIKRGLSAEKLNLVSLSAP